MTKPAVVTRYSSLDSRRDPKSAQLAMKYARDCKSPIERAPGGASAGELARIRDSARKLTPEGGRARRSSTLSRSNSSWFAE